MMRKHVPTSTRDWLWYEEKEPREWRHFDTSSQLCSLNGNTLWFCVHEIAWAHSVMLIFTIFNVFHKIQSTRNTFLPNSTTTLSCTRSPSTLPMFVPTVPHGQFCTCKPFFSLVDRLVCRKQSSHTVDASIKYVAYYCIVYSGQVEIRLSVLQPVGYYSVKVLVYFTFRFIEFIIFKQREFGALHTQYLHAHASIQIVHK